MRAPRSWATSLLAMLFLAVGDVEADTYYVRTSGDDENNGTATTTAFATISRAAAVAGSGDTVYVGGGTYTDAIYILGAKGSGTLRFVADILGVQTGDSGPVVVANATIRVAGCNNVKLKKFTFQGNLAYPLIWQGSFDGVVENCIFLGGTQALLIKGGSLTLENCQLSNFQNDAVQIDGAARLTIRDCDISDSFRHAIHVRKDAVTLLENTSIADSGEDGLHVQVTTDLIALGDIPLPNCDCHGTSPLDMRQQAYDTLADITPEDPVYQQIIADSLNKLNNTLNSSLWSDEWHLDIASAAAVFDDTSDVVEQIHAVLNEDVEFIIENGKIVVNHPFVADVQVVGAAINNGSYDVPVTTKIDVGDTNYQPWGGFTSPTGGNVNDNNNPRTFESPDTFEETDTITVAATSWLKTSSSLSGSQDSHWEAYMTVDSNSNSPFVIVLRDGDEIPDISGYNGQSSAEDFLQPYIDDDDKVTLAENQVIFLFELGTTNLGSSAADFQDLVVLVTMRRPASAPLTDEEKDQLTAVLELLLEATESLTNCAIDEATVGGGSSSQLASAEQHYEDGETAASGQAYLDATNEWQTAWSEAKAATGNVEPDLDAALAQLIQPAPPSSWTPVSQGSLSVTGSQVTGNENGVLAETAHDFTASGSDFSGNQTWGLALQGTCTLNNCTVGGNQYGGLMLTGMADNAVAITNSQLSNNTEYGAFFANCQLTIDPTELGDLSISGSNHVLAGQSGSLTLDGVTISGGQVAGVYLHQGTLTAQNSTFSNNGYGIAGDGSVVSVDQSTLTQNTVGLYTNNNDTVSVTNSNIHDNTVSGATINSPNATVTFSSSQIYGNQNGISLSGASNGDFQLQQTVVRDNSQHGLHFENCNLTIANQAADGWRTLRNGCGITGNQSTISLTDVEIEESVSYGIYCVNSNVTLTRCTVVAAHGVYVASDNQSFSANATDFRGTGASNTWGLSQDGGTVTVTNCVVSGFDNGVLLSGGTSSVLNCTVVSGSSHGLHVAGGNATVKNTILVGANGAQGLTRTSGLLSHSHNVVHGFGTPFTGTSPHDSEILKSPKFVDQANGDFHLAVGSPAINSGADLVGQLTSDRDANSRPSHGAFEIGAFEYVNSQGSYRVLDWREQR